MMFAKDIITTFGDYSQPDSEAEGKYMTKRREKSSKKQIIKRESSQTQKSVSKRGPEPETLKITGDWQKAVARVLKHADKKK